MTIELPTTSIQIDWHSAMITDVRKQDISGILREMQFIAVDLERAGDITFPLRSTMEKRYKTLLSEVNTRHSSNY